MAINSSSLQETILKAIDAVVTQRNNELKLDKTITGIVKKNTGTKKGGKPVYEIEYAGGVINAMTQYADDIYTPQSSVYVLVPQGDFSKDKIIIGRASSIQTDRSSSVVAAAVNKYSIVGSNLLESTSDIKISNLDFGLRSFHEKEREEKADPDSINHRAYFIYRQDVDGPIKFADDRLNIYKEESSAIMIKADFKTNLEVAQKNQSGARYGLIFNFAFDNLNKGWGETNGEVLEKVSQIVSGTIEEVENNTTITKDVTLKEYVVDNFYNRLTDSDTAPENVIEWIETNGLLDQELERTQALYQSFSVDQSELNTDIVKNTVQAYLGLLQELKGYNTLKPMQLRYNTWIETVIGDNAQKFEQFVLTSDDMIGNPFNFSKWNTQYAVFEINLETFNHLDSILFYHEGFIQDYRSEVRWPLNKIKEGGGPDIFVKNLQIYAMNPLDNQSGDYVLKVEPAEGMDMIISSANPNTQFRATLLRKMYEDLTANAKVSYYWFQESSSVINADSTGYHYLGGPGWRIMEHNETNYLFSSSIETNYAYKNNYKCVAVYEPAADDKTILSCLFTIYNEDKALDIKLESDKGTKFSFDAGAPLITVLINRARQDENSPYEEIGFDPETQNPEFLYSWAIADASNNYTLFLNEIMSETNSVQDAMLLDSKQDLLRRIKKYVTYNKNDFTYTRETSISERATRIEYPVSISSSGFTVTCYVKQYNDNLGYYLDIGSAVLEFENQDATIVSDYRIQIVNGDQVFQYDEYGKTPCAESRKDPLVIKPLQAKLFTPSGVEVTGTNYQVEWIVPVEDTMLLTSVELQKNPNTGLNQNYIARELAFSIADLYDYNAYNNQFTCHIRFNGKDYYKDTNFYVGKVGNNGTNGTDVIAKINYKGNDLGNTLHYQPLTLYVQKQKDNEGNITGRGMWNIGSSMLKETVPIVSPQENVGVLDLSVYQKNNLLGESNYNIGYPKWNIAGNANGRVNEVAKFFSLGQEGMGDELNWSYSNLDETRYRMQNIRAEVSIKDDKEDQEDPTYYAFYSLPIIEYESVEEGELPVNSLLPGNRIAINKDSYLKEIVYNADGRNPIYNHNQGLELINLPENAIVSWIAKGGLDAIKSSFSNSIKQVMEAKPSITIIPEKDNEEGVLSYITSETNLINKAKIYILPNDTFDGAATNNRIEAKVFIPKIKDPQIVEEEALKKKYIEQIEKGYEELIALYNTYVEKVLATNNSDMTSEELTTIIVNLRSDFSNEIKTKINNFISQFENKELIKDLFKTALSHIRDNQQAEKSILMMQSLFSEDLNFSKVTNFDMIAAEIQKELEKITYDELHKEEIILKNYDAILDNDIYKQDAIMGAYSVYLAQRSQAMSDYDLGLIETEEELAEKLKLLQDDYSRVLQQQLSQISESKQEYLAIYNSCLKRYEELKQQSENIDEKKKANQIQLMTDAVKALYDIEESFEESIGDLEESLDNLTNSASVVQKIKNIKNQIEELKKKMNDSAESENSNPIVDIETGEWIEDTDFKESNIDFNIKEYLTSIEEFFLTILDPAELNNDEIEGYKLYATVYAPIHMSLNTFGLASVNAWDGNSITIDNDRGAVLAPQIAAGEKDSNNRFTGIVMGKTKTYTGDANGEKQTGLFGFAYGLQSIFLDAETGNATFGLPEGNALEKDGSGHYTNLVQDDYGEGRIELRPGDISRIGGWRLGRRSIYYTTKPKLKNNWSDYVYDGTIGEKYADDLGTPGDRQYGAHHEKDIKTEDGGLLLSANPPYISIKGQRLSEAEIDTGLNSQLKVGDSLEIQLDPQTPTLFTIFRHNSPDRDDSVRNKRQFLAGINDKGELLANGVGKEDGNGTGTKSGNIILKAFKDTIDQDTGSYVGAVFEAGSGLASTRTFFQIFRSKDNPLDTTSQVYITGGQSTSSGEMQDNIIKDEYQRPISIHGKTLMLYAQDSNSENYDSPITDANVQIATNNAQINLGESTQLFLNRIESNSNTLKTAGVFNWEVGTKNKRKDLNIDAAHLTENYTKILTTNTGKYELKNTGTTIINSEGNITLNKITLNEDSSPDTNSFIGLTTNDITLSVPRTIKVNNTVKKINNYLKIVQNDDHKWLTDNQSIKIQTSGQTKQLCLIADDNPSSTTATSNESGSQIVIRAGKSSDHYTRILMATHISNWAGGAKGSGSQIGGKYKVDGVPFTLAVMGASGGSDSEKRIEIRHNFLEGSTSAASDDKGIYAFCIGMETRSPSLVLTDKVYTQSGGTDYSFWAVNGIHTEQQADLISFSSTTFHGNTTSYTRNNLKAIIEDCLRKIDGVAADLDTLEAAYNSHTHYISTVSASASKTETYTKYKGVHGNYLQVAASSSSTSESINWTPQPPPSTIAITDTETHNYNMTGNFATKSISITPSTEDGTVTATATATVAGQNTGEPSIKV